MLCKFSLRMVFLAGALLGLTLGCGKKDDSDAPAGSSAIAGAADTDYITVDYFAAAVVYPRRIADSPLLAPLLKGGPAAKPLQEIRQSGLDPLTIDRATVLFPVPDKSLPKSEQTEPSFILRFNEPVDTKTLLTKLGRGKAPKELTVAGKTCYEDPSGGKGLACAVDDRTLLLAGRGKGEMEKMLTAKGTATPLVERLRQLDAGADLAVVAAFDEAREAVGRLVEQAKLAAPPPLAGIVEIPELAQGLTLTAKLSGDTLLRTVIDGKDDASAARVESTLRKAVEDGKKALQQAEAEMPDGFKEQFAPALKLAKDALAGTEIRKTGAQVEATVRRPPGLDEAIKKLGDMAKTTGAAAQQTNKLKMVALAMLQYESAHRVFPAAAVRGKDGKPLLSWRVTLLPMFEEAALFEQFHLDEPWDSPHNLALVGRMPTIYQTPGGDKGKTSIMLFTGQGTAFSGEKGPTMPEIRDGSSNTILAVEAGPDKAVIWTKPQDLPFDPANPRPALGQTPANGFQAVFFDGHVQRIGPTVDPATLKAMITPNGGEEVGGSK